MPQEAKTRTWLGKGSWPRNRTEKYIKTSIEMVLAAMKNKDQYVKGPMF